MAMVNARSLKTTLKIFFKENARYPDFEEFRKLMFGESLKEKVISQPNETEPKQEG
jgi:hypothetical protein